MDNSTRRRRFKGRVSLERTFITPVNTAFGSAAPLAGMTRDAIQAWVPLAEAAYPDTNNIRKIAAVLMEASARGDLMADHSRDVFDPEARPAPEAMTELAKLLEKVLSETRNMPGKIKT
ncbi:hypothetical protein [Ferrovibrio sp.]|uniref:hypothetical protein n=1 Tax=Ferrovibrio sp. TaxID=1917215 RepID=UPI003D09BDB7